MLYIFIYYMDVFLDIMSNLICNRCSPKGGSPHHNGYINKFLIPGKKINEEYYKNYFNDIEHGFFHAISSCYIYYILNNNQVDEQTVSSLLLHDFLKCNGFSQEKHDIELINYFPNLLSETYTHSNPPDENKILIKCDRMELRRYDDYKSWIDDRHYKLYTELSENQKEKIEDFYNNIRPTLQYFYKNRNEIFIRHGIENIHYNYVNQVYPPDNCFLTVDAQKSYPIEIDRVPFGYMDCQTNEQKGFCSNHGLHFFWNKIKGYITYKKFIQYEGKIINTEKRDHLYAKSNININDWTFIYQDIEENNMHKLLFKKNNINIISQKILSKFNMFFKLFQDRLIVLNKID